MISNVLVVVDGRGHILERLAREWTAASSSGRLYELAYSDSTHPYELRRRGERAGMVLWVDPLAFAANPAAIRVPQCVVVHHLTEPEIQHFRAALVDADSLATISVRWQRRLHDLTGRESVILPQAVDTTNFGSVSREDARRALEIRDQEFVVGFSAKFKADAFGRKGTDLMLEVLSLAASRWRDISVLLIGSGWDALSHNLHEAGLRVIRAEPERTEETARLYPAMDVLLCTSKEEGGPATILEAMACGVPVLTTDVGHVPEIVSDRRTGFIVDVRDAQTFVDRLDELRSSRAFAARMGAAAREFTRAYRDNRHLDVGPSLEILCTQAEERFSERAPAEIRRRGRRLAALRLRYIARRATNVIVPRRQRT